MSFLQAFVLGVVQGITEFFPISSSGHLILLPHFFGWLPHSLAFDAVLHLGTGLAVLFYFWRDWLKMIQDSRLSNSKFSPNAQRLVLIVIASLPLGLAGLLLSNFVETQFRSPLLVAVALSVIAVLMLLSEKVGSKAKERTDLASAMVIGFSQVLALIPGVSRSGITMTAGLFRGLKREEAARFSFLLATPVILAAGLWGLLSFSSLVTNYLLLVTGFLSSFLAGFLAVKFFLKLVERWGLGPFAIYRILLAILILVTIL